MRACVNNLVRQEITVNINPRKRRLDMTKRIFLAGASGAIGRRLAPLLVANGWHVIGSTRSEGKVSQLKTMGVEPAVVDVFDSTSLQRLLDETHPEIVIHQLTDLPYALEASQMTAALVRNARLRDAGTRNLVAAAVHAGVKRMIAQSISFIYEDGPTPHRETDPLLPITHPVYGETVQGVMSLERQVVDAPLVGIVLRYGLLYGPGTGFDQAIAAGSVHVDAAARAAELAVTKGQRGIYNVAETDGATSSDKAIESFGWDSGWRCPS
jgi:nucleoside-diphosphate-sugar epimerase